MRHCLLGAWLLVALCQLSSAWRLSIINLSDREVAVDGKRSPYTPFTIRTSLDLELTIVIRASGRPPTLKVLKGKFDGSWQRLADGALQFTDRTYVLGGVPADMVGMWYWRGPCHSQRMAISITTDGTVYLLASKGTAQAARDALSLAPTFSTRGELPTMTTTSYPATKGFVKWTLPAAVRGWATAVSRTTTRVPGPVLHHTSHSRCRECHFGDLLQSTIERSTAKISIAFCGSILLASGMNVTDYCHIYSLMFHRARIRCVVLNRLQRDR